MKWCELREHKWNDYVIIEYRGHGFESRWSHEKPFFRATSQLPKLRFNCDGHIFISFVSPQFTSFHSVHCFRGLMNSINWPTPSVWVFIAQLVEHCSANAEATGSNTVESPKNFFFSGYFAIALIAIQLRWSHIHFIRFDNDEAYCFC